MNGKLCIIKGDSDYFKGKYGTPNPEIHIEAPDTTLWPGGWREQAGNPACVLYGMRNINESLPYGGIVYYGKIKTPLGGGLGELVHESELELV